MAVLPKEYNCMNIKRKICIFVIISLLLSFVSCDSENNNEKTNSAYEESEVILTFESTEIEDSADVVIDESDEYSLTTSFDDSDIHEESVEHSCCDSIDDCNSSEESGLESEEYSCEQESSDDEQLSDLNASSDDEESGEESSEDQIDPLLAQSFVIYGPEISYNLSWESDGLELYNTEFRMSDELAQKFKTQINSFANAQSIMLIELDTNMTFAYSKDTKIATASSIKGPVGLYVNKCIDAGIISWDTYKSYQPRHFQANSTGKVQNYSYGTSFSVETLMDYMIRISDNQAYLMLKELVGASNFNYMMKTLGCSEIIAPGSNWGYITAKEMAAAWREIYYYSLEGESGAKLFDRYMHAQYNYIWRSIPQYEAAHKSGWSGKAFNDAGVVFADGHEYVLVVLCGRSGVKDPRSQYQFTAITKLLAELMVEYNTYKVENGL